MNPTSRSNEGEALAKAAGSFDHLQAKKEEFDDAVREFRNEYTNYIEDIQGRRDNFPVNPFEKRLFKGKSFRDYVSSKMPGIIKDNVPTRIEVFKRAVANAPNFFTPSNTILSFISAIIIILLIYLLKDDIEDAVTQKKLSQKGRKKNFSQKRKRGR